MSVSKPKPPRKFMCYGGPANGQWLTWETAREIKTGQYYYNQYNNSGGYGPSAVFLWVNTLEK